MVKLYSDLSAPAQTAYSQLLDDCISTQQLRSIADLKGSFAVKQVKGNAYWYFQYREPVGKIKQIFVGRDSEKLRILMDKKIHGNSVIDKITPLADAAIALGCTEVLPKHIKVISRLYEYGFFRAGGVLVGTHAFLAYGNMLGVKWGDSSRTQDIDFAHAGKSVSIALPSNIEVQTQEAIDSLNMGFLPIQSLGGKNQGSHLSLDDPSFRLDFLTTLHRGGEEPFLNKQLNIVLQPLRFMEFSLQDVYQAIIFDRSKAILVNVPNPVRYCLHKLIVYGIRSGAYMGKSNKDLLQAASLLAYFKESNPDRVQLILEDLFSRGKGWVSKLKVGAKALDKAYPEVEINKWLNLTKTI